MASDRILHDKERETALALERERAERRDLERKLDEERQRNAERDRRHTEELAKSAMERRESEHRAEIAAITAKIEALTAAKSAPVVVEKSPAESAAMMIAALAPLAPVFAAMISSGKEAQIAQMNAQAAQNASLMQVMMAQSSKPAVDPMDTILKLSPLFAPLLANLGKGPDMQAQTTLIKVAAESQAASTAMITQLLGAMAESGQPEQAKSILAELLPHLGPLADTAYQMWTQSQKANQAPQAAQAPRQLPPGAVIRPAPAPAPAPAVVASQPHASQSVVASGGTSYGSLEVEVEGPNPTPHLEAVEAGQSGQPDQPQALAVLTSRSMPMPPGLVNFLPEGMRGAGWKGWLKAVHAGEPSDELGADLAELIDQAVADEVLPEHYIEQFSEDPRLPLANLSGLLTPCVQNPAYASSIIDHALVRLQEIAIEQEEADGEEGDDEPENDEPAAVDSPEPFPEPSPEPELAGEAAA